MRLGKAVERVQEAMQAQEQRDVAEHEASGTERPDCANLRERKAAQRPVVVCLCGSTRFYDEFTEVYFRETMAGRIVLSVGFFRHEREHAHRHLEHGESVGITTEEKAALDELHKRKIDMADEVLILNVGGYIGQSTQSELEYAIANGKRVRFLEDVQS